MRAVIVFDGQCGFCRGQIRRLEAWDRDRRIEFVSSNSPGLSERFPILAGADFNTGLRLIDSAGRVSVGPDALYHVARLLPYWRRIAWLYRLPCVPFIARRIYGWVAARRHSLGRDRGEPSCPVSSPKHFGPGEDNRRSA